jgi:hypothetical protein
VAPIEITFTARTGSGAGAGLLHAANIKAALAASIGQEKAEERSMGSRRMDEGMRGAERNVKRGTMQSTATGRRRITND